GTVPVNFLASNHTSGGNSGSPVINAKGQLIGLNFDRISEGIMSDYVYNPDLSRNIVVDIRFILFVIDKYGGCRRLIDEMKIVKE
ncbi:MAG TPA: S46 family peptidase, partial [Bacteroidia bacterium]|nr:S46 family peptidase [Bacteroidia bacterium]